MLIITTPWIKVFIEQGIFAQLFKKFPTFKKFDGSLPYLKLATGLYPEL